MDADIWKVEIRGGKVDSNAVCCAVVVRATTEATAVQRARNHAKDFEVHSGNLDVKSCGLASDKEAKLLKEGEDVALVMYKPNKHGDSD